MPSKRVGVPCGIGLGVRSHLALSLTTRVKLQICWLESLRISWPRCKMADVGASDNQGEMADLLAKQEITELLYRYCRGVDRLDMELVRSCYHPDATDSHGTFEGTVDEYLVWSERLLRRYTGTVHTVLNVLIEVEPDPVASAGEGIVRWARSEAHGIARHWTEGGPPELNLSVGFRFIDDVCRRGDGPWLISRRVATTEWVREEQFRPFDERFLRGSRDRSDPVYAPRPG
ncbi:MAG: nuclear transport factor 2 family protein [Acidimicrobiia bacterium]|nr:nuclear transport factor 2 family protein [Acidimicrobiia bacterium]MYG72908.1 nuclear transport factor 2 family protein [Acidimicrobiia bacterium]MYH97789.1 nuclear transport factor 2 family protein [Acidimicrobiia bacterium]MYL10316.1 nuclear transport factor 2 family protein [Acidimicrobiia bacterium]